MPSLTLRSLAGTITIPGLKWIGSPPAYPVQSDKQMDIAVMASGAKRVAFFGTKRKWPMGLGYLNKTQLDLMLLQNSYSQILVFKNTFEDTTEYNVVITTFKHEPERVDIRQMERYKIVMTLEEV